MIPSRSDFTQVRGKRTHVLHWGREGAPKVFMVHGWMDVGASFQFVVDCLKGDWHVIAPDWRGFGLSERNGTDTYWFPDYVADLDAILRHRHLELAAQQQAQCAQEGRLVVHAQHFGQRKGLHAAALPGTGRCRATLVPWPGALRNATRPPWPCTMSRTR